MQGTHPNTRANLTQQAQINSEIAKERKQAFLTAFKDCAPNTARVCDALDIPYSSIRVWKATDEKFAEEYQHCIDRRLDQIEDKLFDVSINDRGYASLGFGLLRAHRKHLYGDKLEHSGSVATVNMTHSAGLGTVPVPRQVGSAVVVPDEQDTR